MGAYRYLIMDVVYGPIRSLRYGSTLGINLLSSESDGQPVGEKVCSFNCVYCDLGPTKLTMNKVRKDYEFPTLEKLREAFKSYITRSVVVDAIVVSGNGEPTLYPDFDEAMKLLCDLRTEHVPGTKIVVLSNGAHLDQKKVVAGLNLVDERVIKIDAGNDTYLQKVNDPLIRINMARFLDGFRKLNGCTIESMFIGGPLANTTPECIEDWIEVIGMVKPRAVQIYSLHRPSLVRTDLIPLTEDALYSIAFKLKKRTTIEAQVFR